MVELVGSLNDKVVVVETQLQMVFVKACMAAAMVDGCRWLF